MQKSRIVFFFLVLTACQASTAPVAPTPTFTEILPPLSPPTISVGDEAMAQFLNIQLVWEKSPHAVRPSNDALNTDGTWRVIRCDNCHENKGGVVDATIAWWNPETRVYESVLDSNALCQKCHADILAPAHQETSKTLAHQGFECAGCHDPHSVAASCSNSACHTKFLQNDNQLPATPIGIHPDLGNPFCGGASCHPVATQAASNSRSVHGFSHAAVACVACHDASGLQVGPDQNGELWVAWQTVAKAGDSITSPYSSHSIQIEVDCKRCHFRDNTWNLPIVTGNEFDN